MNNIQGKFSNLLVLTGISLLSGLVFSFIAIFAVSLIFNVSVSEVSSSLDGLTNNSEINQAKVILFFNSVGLFIIPALLFCKIKKQSFVQFFQFRNNKTLLQIPVLILLLILCMPVINFASELNSYLQLPSFLGGLEEWMKNAEDSAMRVTKAFLEMNGIKALSLNIILIGVLPAIGEELFFRGVVQQTLTKNSKNPHIGIWTAAIIFSAIHFQFYGFLPRMLLGAYFGYLYYWSKNIWLPIVAHFLNNGLAVLAAYYLGQTSYEKDLETVGTLDNYFWFSLVSLILFSTVLKFLKDKLTN